jgi:hypothetical protein
MKGSSIATNLTSEDENMHINTRCTKRGSGARQRLVAMVGSLAIVTLACPLNVAAGWEHFMGKWEGPYDWPVVAIHAALLPDGTVMAYDSVGDHATETYPQEVTQTRAMLWDPTRNPRSSKAVTSALLDLGYNLFCSGLGMLPNGHVFIAGGNLNTPSATLLGIPNLTDYDSFGEQPFADRFAAVGQMTEHRWYPSVTALANGETVVTGGVDGASTPEVRAINGDIRQLSGAYSQWGSSRIYQWLKLAPNGNVALLGPGADMRFLKTDGAGAWEQDAHQRRDNMFRDYGSHVLYDIGQVLVVGGGVPATRSAVTVDLDSMSSADTSSMYFERRQHNLTVLPDGSVLATGGFAGSSFFFDFKTAVYFVERWNPRTGRWSIGAPMRKLRGYHSIALLLPDGRVLSAGGGICGQCQGNYLEKNAEVYSPPYLFKTDGSGRLAARPEITSAPDEIVPGEQFDVRVKWFGSLKSMSLIRLGAVTHSTNMDQRYIPLEFSQGHSGRVSVLAPTNNNIAPPGHYMLFACPTNGAPSIAKIVKVSGGRTRPSVTSNNGDAVLNAEERGTSLTTDRE